MDCHCTLCRRSTGGLWQATAAQREDIAIRGDENMNWLEAKPKSPRGSCATCGTSMFVKGEGRPHTTVTAGTLDKPTGRRLTLRIFTVNTGDYHLFGDEVPTFPSCHNLTFPEGGGPPKSGWPFAGSVFRALVPKHFRLGEGDLRRLRGDK